jgi:lipoprotein-releasing system permease protein
MKYTGFIAGRYLRSRRNDGFFSFISTIATLGITLGTATLIIALAILGGFEREITEKVVGFTSHVQILGFQNQPLDHPDKTVGRIEGKFPAVRGVAPFAAREALIRSRHSVDGIFLKGIDPLRDYSTTRRYIVQGSYALDREQGGLPKLVLGKKLATKLDVSVGDRVTVFGIGRQADNSQPRVMQFRVAGIYESGMAEYDDIYAFTDLRDAQILFQLGESVTGYDIFISSLDSAAAIAERLQNILGYPHYARTVFETYRNLFSWIDLQKKPVPIILSLIIIVATVNIIGTLLMMVLNKTREIGVLMSLGASPRSIASIFVRQGLIIGAVGTVLGNILAFVICFSQQEFRFFSLPSDIYFMTSVPILLRSEYFLLVSVVTLLLCLLSSFVPARLASRLRPVQALRFS